MLDAPGHACGGEQAPTEAALVKRRPGGPRAWAEVEPFDGRQFAPYRVVDWSKGLVSKSMAPKDGANKRQPVWIWPVVCKKAGEAKRFAFRLLPTTEEAEEGKCTGRMGGNRPEHDE